MQHSWTWMRYAAQASLNSSCLSHTMSSRGGCTKIPAASRFGVMEVVGRPFGDLEDGTTRGSTESRRGCQVLPIQSTTTTIPTSSETGIQQCGTTTLKEGGSKIPAPSVTVFAGKMEGKTKRPIRSISPPTQVRQLTSDSVSEVG